MLIKKIALKITTDYATIAMLAISSAIVAYDIYLAFTLPTIIHEEIAVTANNFINKNGESNYVLDLIQKSFNLCALEECGYRPRLLAFIINYIDLNVTYLTMLHFDARFFLYLTAAALPLIWLSLYLLLKETCEDINNGVAAIISSLFLYHEGIQAAIHTLNRSAKLLTVSAAAFIIYLALRRTRTDKRTPINNVATAALYFLLFTMDEQLIVCGIIATLLVIAKAGSRKIDNSIRPLAFGLIAYGLFYAFIAPPIFDYFTPGDGFLPHAHNPSFLKNLVFNNEALTSYSAYTLMIFTSSLSSIFLGVYGLLFSSTISYIGLTSKKDTQTSIEILIMTLGAFFLLLAILYEHPTIIKFRDLNNSLYTTIPIMLVITSLTKGINQIDSNNNQKTLALMVFTLTLTRGAMNVESGSRIHASLFGGHIDHTYSTTQTKNGIIFEKRPLENYLWTFSKN